jgi:hypothetical protein
MVGLAELDPPYDRSGCVPTKHFGPRRRRCAKPRWRVLRIYAQLRRYTQKSPPETTPSADDQTKGQYLTTNDQRLIPNRLPRPLIPTTPQVLMDVFHIPPIRHNSNV